MFGIAHESFAHPWCSPVFTVKYEKCFNLFTSLIWEIWSEVELSFYYCINGKNFLEGGMVSLVSHRKDLCDARPKPKVSTKGRFNSIH